MEDSIEKRFSLANEALSKIQPCEYKLIFDRREGREKLSKALKQSRHRIVIVCPWVTNFALNALITDIKSALANNVKIYIGWGHFNDINEFKKSNPALNQAQINDQFHVGNRWYDDGIPQLTALQQAHSGKIVLRLLGTHEKFLICDNEWALITSYNFLTSSATSPEREIGLVTNDQNIIKKLIERYNN